MVGPAAKGPINPPNKRHNLNQIGRSSRPDSVNTVVLPDADVAGDLEAIQTGQATWNPASCRYEINGRSYGVEPNGTVFPVEGPGFVQLSRSEYQALKGVIQAGGKMNDLPSSLARNPSISAADWEKAASVYKHHKNHSGEGL